MLARLTPGSAPLLRRYVGVYAVAISLMLIVGSALPVASQTTDPALGNGVGAVRPGDQIGVRVWRDEDLSGQYTVDHNGNVVLPRLGVVNVAGRPADELQRWLAQAFEQFVPHPSIEITLLRRVGVHGEVRKPDLYMVDLTTTLRDLIAKAGGLTEVADPNRIVIVRDGEQIRVGRYEGAQFMTAELRSGDQIVISRRNWILLNPLAIISTATTVASLLLVAFR
jgi:protein involved in polysaccharide export with SLBB domain